MSLSIRPPCTAVPPGLMLSPWVTRETMSPSTDINSAGFNTEHVSNVGLWALVFWCLKDVKHSCMFFYTQSSLWMAPNLTSSLSVDLNSCLVINDPSHITLSHCSDAVMHVSASLQTALSCECRYGKKHSWHIQYYLLTSFSNKEVNEPLITHFTKCTCCHILLLNGTG